MSATSDTTFAVHAACIRGVEAVPVTVEVSMTGSIPGICIVGLGDTAVMDARVRIRSALHAGGYEMPRRNITVNLAPGDMRKTGTGFDLPIMVAILAISGQIPKAGLDQCLFNGELALDGGVLPMRAEVPYALLAREEGLTLVGGFSSDHVELEGVTATFLEHVGDLRRGAGESLRAFTNHASALTDGHSHDSLDFADVIGQEVAKRALAIAATGGLGMLMVGSPGAGKTMLARRMTTILPPIGESERQEALRIHSVMEGDVSRLLQGERPFRSPHHSISTAGLVGGGRPVHPGEISLAHGAFSSWMSSPSSLPPCSSRSGSRWSGEACVLSGPRGPTPFPPGSNCLRRVTRVPAGIWAIARLRAPARPTPSSATRQSLAGPLRTAST